METQETYIPAPESVTDWEDGVADVPTRSTDYNRASHTQALDEGPEAETNSDLGNLGRDVQNDEADQPAA